MSPKAANKVGTRGFLEEVESPPLGREANSAAAPTHNFVCTAASCRSAVDLNGGCVCLCCVCEREGECV